MRLALLMCCLPGAAFAQYLTFDIAPTADCMAQEAGLSCVGRAANACMEASEGGSSTNGMSGCTDQELSWWDERLNTIYKALRAVLARRDAEAPDYAPPQGEALQEMQRAWIAFRDAKCEFVASEWTGGTGAGPATLWCLMDETARQSLYLKQRAEN